MTRRALCLLCLFVLAGCAPAPDDRPDIFLITIDTLRADHLGCYGYPRDTSPALDRFAQGAVVFGNAQAHSPETRPSFGSLFSGFLPHETKAGVGGAPLVPEIDTLAELLDEHDYTTLAVVSNYVLRAELGWNQGFDRFDDTMDERELNRAFPERTAGHTTARAIELLEEHEGERLFMWVHYQDPHGPYVPPASTAERFLDHGAPVRLVPVNDGLSGLGGIPSYQRLGDERDYHDYVARYDAEIRFADEQLGLLLEALAARDRYDDAWVVITSDHGENMGEHDYYFCHGENLYSGLTRVPLIVRFGDGGDRGRRDDLVQHIDLLPTVTALLGLEPDPHHRGVDLRDAITERSVFAEARSALSVNGLQVSLIHDGYKLIATPAKQRYELFDLANDPHEARDLVFDPDMKVRIGSMVEVVNQIRSVDHLRIGEPDVPQLTEDELERLRSLGYAQ